MIIRLFLRLPIFDDKSPYFALKVPFLKSASLRDVIYLHLCTCTNSRNSQILKLSKRTFLSRISRNSSCKHLCLTLSIKQNGDSKFGRLFQKAVWFTEYHCSQIQSNIFSSPQLLKIIITHFCRRVYQTKHFDRDMMFVEAFFIVSVFSGTINPGLHPRQNQGKFNQFNQFHFD